MKDVDYHHPEPWVLPRIIHSVSSFVPAPHYDPRSVSRRLLPRMHIPHIPYSFIVREYILSLPSILSSPLFPHAACSGTLQELYNLVLTCTRQTSTFPGPRIIAGSAILDDPNARGEGSFVRRDATPEAVSRYLILTLPLATYLSSPYTPALAEETPNRTRVFCIFLLLNLCRPFDREVDCHRRLLLPQCTYT